MNTTETETWVKGHTMTSGIYIDDRIPMAEKPLGDLERGMCFKSQRNWHRCLMCRGKCAYGIEIITRMSGRTENDMDFQVAYENARVQNDPVGFLVNAYGLTKKGSEALWNNLVKNYGSKPVKPAEPKEEPKEEPKPEGPKPVDHEKVAKRRDYYTEVMYKEIMSQDDPYGYMVERYGLASRGSARATLSRIRKRFETDKEEDTPSGEQAQPKEIGLVMSSVVYKGRDYQYKIDDGRLTVIDSAGNECLVGDLSHVDSLIVKAANHLEELRKIREVMA